MSAIIVTYIGSLAVAAYILLLLANGRRLREEIRDRQTAFDGDAPESAADAVLSSMPLDMRQAL
jgi:hypothetical protein